MNNKRLKLFLVGVGVPILLLLFLGPILMRFGIDSFCITGSFPDLRIGRCSGLSVYRPIVTQYPFPTASSESPIPIIVDDDGSPDGIIALLYFLRHPHYEVKAVTVSQGEAHPQVFAPQIAQLLANLGREDIPVGFGREVPLEGDNAFPEPWREASDRFFGIPLSRSPSATTPRSASEVIIEALNKSSEPVAVFISGTHTNVAEVLRIQPGITERIRAVYVMGGSIHVPGNIESGWSEIDNSVAEWNIWVDPLAASEVFTAGIPIHLVPLDATNQVTWTKADIETWKTASTPEADVASSILDMMLRTMTFEAVYIWDLVAAVAATDPRLCPETPLALEVRLDPGSEQGQLQITEDTANVWACLDPDAGQIRARVETVFGY